MHEIGNVGDTHGEPAARLLAFAGRLRRQHVRAAAQGALVRTLLILGGPWILAAWFAPAVRVPVAIVALVVALTAVFTAAWRAHRTAESGLLRAEPGAAGAGVLDLVGCELATWLEQRRQPGHDQPMVQWLGRDVAGRLPTLPKTTVAAVGRRRLGRLRRLVPVVLVLLLCWLLAEWLMPPWPGVLGGGGASGAHSATGSGSGSGSGDPSGTGGGAGRQSTASDQPMPPEPQPEPQPEPAPSVPEPRDEPPPQPRQPPPPQPETPAPDVVPAAPAPLLQLPEQQRFVVPEFVGDGPTRRVRMHAAEVERAGGAPPPPPSTGAGGSGELQAPPPLRPETFERAAEAASRARHVPAEERPMVRRFFELLQQRAR